MTSDTSDMPSRMSAMVKSNPVSLAQQEKMMRRSGPAIQRFQLSRVREMTGTSQEGWFSSKLLTMKYLSEKSNNNKSITNSQQPDVEKWFSSSSGKVKLQIIDDFKIPVIKELNEHLRSDDSTNVNVIKRPGSRPSSRQQLPDFSRNVVRSVTKWPKDWFIRHDDESSTLVSPGGHMCGDLVTALHLVQHQSSAASAQLNRKTMTPNKRKLFNVESLAKKSPIVLRKLNLEGKLILKLIIRNSVSLIRV